MDEEAPGGFLHFRQIILPPIRLLVTLGDPAGIGPEVLLRSLVHPPAGARLNVIGDLRLLRPLARRLRVKIPWDRYDWVDLANTGPVRAGCPGPASGRAAYAYLEEAVRRLKRGEADALVTGPVSKEVIARSGIRWRGHTEYLAGQFRCRTTMMFVTGRVRVSLVTTHWAIREVPRRLKREEVVRVLEATRRAMVRDFGIRRPRIGLAALNPHGGEGGMFGGEEKKILLPAARRVPGVAGPLPADSLIQHAARGEYDAVAAIYHDQALIPVKLLGWERAVNVTLGLPFVRTSPVHGTAFDIAGKGKADPSSMQSAIALAIQLARRRG